MKTKSSTNSYRPSVARVAKQRLPLKPKQLELTRNGHVRKRRVYQKFNLPMEEAFKGNWYVDDKTGCWIWTRGIDGKGYGRLSYGGCKRIIASRASWIIHHGPIPDGLYVCHHCDVKACVNPDHLFLGTQLDNMRDYIAKGGIMKPPPSYGEKNNKAKLTEADVIEIRKLTLTNTNAEIARRFGISSTNVGCIKRRLNWKHI